MLITNKTPSKQEESEIQDLLKNKNLDLALEKINELYIRYPDSIVPKYYDAYIKNIQMKHEEAIELYLDVISSSPNDSWVFHYNVGLIFYNLRRFIESIKYLTKAYSLNPNNPSVLLSLGGAYYENFQFNQAENTFNKLIRLDPNSIIAYCNLANIELQRSNIIEALKYSSKALELNDTSSYANSTHAVVLSRSKDIKTQKESVTYFEKAISYDPNDANSYANLAGVNFLLNELEECKINADKALKINPKNNIGMQNLATYYQAKGDKTKTKKLYEKILSDRPENGGIFKDYAHHFKPSSKSKIIKEGIRVFSELKINKRDLSFIAFGLFHIFDNEANYDLAFNYLEQANNLSCETFDIDINSKINTFDQIIAHNNKNLFLNLGKGGCEDPAPIFIIGMPRSGTSLLEQIISSHSMVYGGGEVGILNNTFEEFNITYSSLPSLSPSDREKFGINYINNMKKTFNKDKFNNEKYFTDKLPQNFLFVGIISLILPQSKIVHIKRNPLDACLSMYSHPFSSGHDYTYDLEALAIYYNCYRKLMKHWEDVLPKTIYDISYDKLVENSETEIKDLLEFCNLPFEDNCLKFYENKREVLTPSSSQVRKEIYKSSSGRSINYEIYLENFKKLIK